MVSTLNTEQEIERIENILKQTYGVTIEERQYVPVARFVLRFSKEMWHPLDHFFQSKEMQHFMDDCRIRSFMMVRAKYRGGVMGDVPQVTHISSYKMGFKGLLSMLEFFVVLLARKGMLKTTE